MLVSDKIKRKRLWLALLSLWLKGSVRIWFNKRGLLLFIIHFIIPRRQSREPQVAAKPIVYCVLVAHHISESACECGWNQVSSSALSLSVRVRSFKWCSTLKLEDLASALTLRVKFTWIHPPYQRGTLFSASSGHRSVSALSWSRAWQQEEKHTSVTCDMMVEKMLSCPLSK